MSETSLPSDLALTLDEAGRAIHLTAIEHGWWDTDRNTYEALALVHAEVSELVEGLRHGNPPSEHIPAFTAAEEEAADVFIRLLDLAAARGWRIGQAMVAKHAFNAGRPYRHGGKLA